MIRLFVGLALPEPVRRHLYLLCGGVPGARWTEERNFHLTVAFIGEVEEPMAEEIDAALSAIAAPGFTLELKGVGQFDRGGHTTVLWAGVAPNPALLHLQSKVQTALERLHAPVEHRKFTPHITLARLRRSADQGRALRFLSEQALFAGAPFPVNEFILFESIRGGDGPVYEPVRRYELG